jgi:hypothetical protein
VRLPQVAAAAGGGDRRSASSAQYSAANATPTTFALGRSCSIHLALSSLPSQLDSITIIRPETVVRWHRMGFAAYWRWKSHPRGGRPRIAEEVRDLIRRMSFENPLWGATKIHGELLKLGIEVAQSTVSIYMVPRRDRPLQSWKTFLAITWRGLRRLICSWFRRLPFNSYSRFWFSGTNGGGCCGSQ